MRITKEEITKVFELWHELYTKDTNKDGWIDGETEDKETYGKQSAEWFLECLRYIRR